MKTYNVCRWILAATVAAVIGQSSASAQNEEFRGLWVDAWGAGFLNQSQVTQLVQDARDHNFNAIVVQMRRRGDAFYMPQAPNQDPRTTALSSSFDALAEIISQAHSGTPRIEVHCWVTTNLIWSSQTAPSQSGHIFNQHPEYLMKSSSGATFIGEGYYADPGHPDAMKWTYNMATDIVSNYAIDGFHWDYVRYPAQDSGYNATALARYNAEFGLTGQPSPSDAQFSDWRRRQVSDFLRWTNADLYEIRPDLIISASVFASRSDAYTHRFQDWAAWNEDGIHDISAPMNYSSSNSTFNSRVDDAYNHQGIRVAYIGQGAYLNSKENTVTQLNYVRNKPMWGTLFYSYRTPNSGTVDKAGTFAYVRDNYQPTWVETPALPWKATPDAGIVKGLITRQDTGEIIYNATVSIDAGSGFTQQSCVQGSYAFYDADDGSWTVTANAAGFGQATANVNVIPGQVVTVNLALPADPGGPVADIVIDNPAASVAGSWSTGTGSTDKYGDNYHFKGQGTGSAYLQFTPQIQTAGNYHVYEWHPQGSNRTLGAPHAITHEQGTDTVLINQQVNGGQWNFVGTYPFAVGSSGHVRITDAFADGGQVVLADAIAFVYEGAGSSTPPNAPGGLAATAISSGQIDLSWTDNSSDEDGFEIERSTDGINFSPAGIVGADVTSHPDTGLSASTTYYYRVYAYNSDGDSAFSNIANATTQGGGSTTMHVAVIQVDRVNLGKGRSAAQAVVTIVDSSGIGVANATVTVNFTEAIVETRSASTDSSGVATIQTNGSASNPARTTGCVSNVTHATLTYNAAANLQTCDPTY